MEAYKSSETIRKSSRFTDTTTRVGRQYQYLCDSPSLFYITEQTTRQTSI